MYFSLGQVTEFDFADVVGNAFKNGDLSKLDSLESQLFSSDKAVVFLDNHDTQRGNAPLTYVNITLQREYSTLLYLVFECSVT